VLIDGLGCGERNEDLDECDERPLADSAGRGPGPTTDDNTRFEADVEDLASSKISSFGTSSRKYEAYLPVDGGPNQHKSIFLQLFSRPFSIAESKDRLKRVRDFSRFDTSGNGLSLAQKTDPQDPLVALEDPAAILVRSMDRVWLAVVQIIDIKLDNLGVQTLPVRLLKEPNVRLKVQLMQLVPTEKPPNPDSEEGDWEWTSQFEKAFGTSLSCEIDGEWVQLLNPSIPPSTRLRREHESTYHF